MRAALGPNGAHRRAVAPTGRRAFLAGGLALGACARLPAASRPRETLPVVVVGAGLGGLTAAYRLRRAGVPVRVLEAQARVGGRVRTLRGFFPDDQRVELGGEFVDSRHQHLRRLATELGLGFDDLTADEPALAPVVWHFGGERRSDAAVVDAFRPLAEGVRRDLAKLRPGGRITYADTRGAEPLDRLSFAEWLASTGARGWVRDLLTVAFVTEFGLDADQQSALNFLLTVEPTAPPLHLYGDSDERYRVQGGNDRLPTALAGALSGVIETETLVEALRERADGALVIAARKGGRPVEIPASHVVLAIPFTLLRTVRLDVPLPPRQRRAIDELAYGTNAKLLLGFSRRIWRDQASNGTAMTDRPLQQVWDATRAQPGDGGVLTNFTGGAAGLALGDGTPASQASRALEDVDAVFPGARAARAAMVEARFHWPSHPYARGSYACYRPGQWTTLAGIEGQPAGRVHFAGEHCSTVAQGFMEGACESGERAARAILRERA